MLCILPLCSCALRWNTAEINSYMSLLRNNSLRSPKVIAVVDMLLRSGITEKGRYHVNKSHPSHSAIWYPDQMNDDPQDSRRPFSLSYPSNSSLKQRHAVFQGQVRAFLEASEIVEMGEEVLDDILDGFDGFDHETSDCVADEQPFIPVRTLVRDAVGNIELPLPHGFYVYFGPQGMPCHSQHYCH